LKYFKAAYDNKAFTLSHCWTIEKDSKKWEDSFALWQELEKKKGEGNSKRIFYPGPDTNGSECTVCVRQMRRSAEDA
jgi:hypothetical protein